jgi:hypothetical protein
VTSGGKYHIDDAQGYDHAVPFVLGNLERIIAALETQADSKATGATDAR